MSDKYVLNEEETRKMHNTQFKMMIELDKICRKHNIKYILDSGSLLRAVRHKGFIPYGFSISPFSLPLKRQVFIPQKDYFHGLFGVFSDSLPDAWGQLLLSRLLKKQGSRENTYGIENMFRRMCFNVFAHNRDDHSKNFIYL